MSQNRTVHYRLRFPAPQTHYIEVEAVFPADGRREVELFLPVWTPGSYLVREYSRHLERLAAAECIVQKTRKNRWHVRSGKPIDEFHVSYSLYCHELSVRTNWVSERYALIIGAATFLSNADDLHRPTHVALELPPGWLGPWSGMSLRDGGFCAKDYDELVDCPIAAGIGTEAKFHMKDRFHSIVFIGDTTFWDIAAATRDVEHLVEAQEAMWGKLPYSSYTFLNLMTSGRGALEHRNSMVLIADRYAMRSRESYVAWLQLVSHEFFHVWNVKSLRPVELGPFDYENEVYTRNLWIAEGFTEYYGLLMVCRAGLCSTDEFLSGKTESLTELVRKLQTTPGRFKQSVTESSFDAWIKLYRPDEHSIHSTISYYTKGAVLAWLLDARVREATQSARSLDDVMRIAYERYGRDRGYSTEEFLSVIEEVGGTEVQEWVRGATELSASELEYDQAVKWFGLRFHPPSGAAKPRIPVSTANEGGRLLVKEVLDPGCPLSPGDEILGIDGHRVRPERWSEIVERYRPGEHVVVHLSRDERLHLEKVEVVAHWPDAWLLELDPEASDEQTANRVKWLKTR